MKNGIYDNRRTFQRERWLNDKVTEYVVARCVGLDARIGRGPFRPATILQPWGTYPDIDQETTERS